MPRIADGEESFKIPVLMAGKGWLALDKPAGITVHNESGHDLCAYAKALISKDPELKNRVDPDPEYGIHPVHRLDKETSGVVLLSANPALSRFFSRQFEARQVRKRYIAILHGRLDMPEEGSAWGSWFWPLAKVSGGRRRPQGTGPKQNSETRYRVVDHSIHYTMAEIEILTGRIHQIRRHAKLAGHPVAGDARYGSTRALKYLTQHHSFDRLALHAKSMTLSLPDQPDPVTVQTESIPEPMLALFKNDSAFTPQAK